MSGDQTGSVLAVLGRLEAGQAQLRTELVVRTDQLRTELTAHTDQLRAELTVHTDQLRTELTARMDQLRAELTARLDRTQSSQDQLRVDLMERIDRLQNQLTLIGDDITVNMGRADLAHRMSDNVRGEMRALNEVVSGMMRQIQRLQTEVRDLRGGH